MSHQYQGRWTPYITERNICHFSEIYAKAAREKQFINKTNSEIGSGFAKTYASEPIEFW